jgi:hypothetical protein
LLGATSGRGSAWLERLVRDQEVGGSNPLAPTNLFNEVETRISTSMKRCPHEGPHEVAFTVILREALATALRSVRVTGVS